MNLAHPYSAARTDGCVCDEARRVRRCGGAPRSCSRLVGPGQRRRSTPSPPWSEVDVREQGRRAGLAAQRLQEGALRGLRAGVDARPSTSQQQITFAMPSCGTLDSGAQPAACGRLGADAHRSRTIAPGSCALTAGHSTRPLAHRRTSPRGRPVLSIAFDLPTQTGYDATGRARPRGGRQGWCAGRAPAQHPRALLDGIALPPCMATC